MIEKHKSHQKRHRRARETQTPPKLDNLTENLLRKTSQISKNHGTTTQTTRKVQCQSSLQTSQKLLDNHTCYGKALKLLDFFLDIIEAIKYRNLVELFPKP